ncbi:hypothetical protein BDV12DRAFT_192004 [Aspergillus spectabilis]
MQFLTLSITLTLLTSSVYAEPQPNEPYHPGLIEKPHGIDSGNTLCTGACVSDPGLLACEHFEFRPKYGCFMCCISDDDLDHLDEKFVPLGEDEEDHDDGDEV